MQYCMYGSYHIHLCESFSLIRIGPIVFRVFPGRSCFFLGAPLTGIFGTLGLGADVIVIRLLARRMILGSSRCDHLPWRWSRTWTCGRRTYLPPYQTPRYR